MGIYLAGCLAPYIVSPSGTCVNTQNDFDNCGRAGYVCPSNHTRCAGGRCNTVKKGAASNEKSVLESAK